MLAGSVAMDGKEIRVHRYINIRLYKDQLALPFAIFTSTVLELELLSTLSLYTRLSALGGGGEG